MSPRAMRRLLFAGAWLLWPWPMIVFDTTWVPAARYAILALAASAVGLKEGAAGPVLPLTLLFVGWAIATTLLCWLMAWLAARVLGRLPGPVATGLTLAVVLAALAVGLLGEPYVTPFGRARTGGLLEILS